MTITIIVAITVFSHEVAPVQADRRRAERRATQAQQERPKQHWKREHRDSSQIPYED